MARPQSIWLVVLMAIVALVMIVFVWMGDDSPSDSAHDAAVVSDEPIEGESSGGQPNDSRLPDGAASEAADFEVPTSEAREVPEVLETKWKLPRWTIRGRLVTEETGEPIAEARVWIGKLSGASDASGRFGIELSTMPRDLTLRVEHPFHRLEWKLTKWSLIALGDIRLRSYGEIRARLVSPDGDPIPDARLHIARAEWTKEVVESQSDEQGLPRDEWERLAFPSEGEDGARRLSMLLPGKYTLWAGSPDWSASGVVDVQVAGRETREVQLELREPGRISGRLIRSTGAPGIPVPLDFDIFLDFARGQPTRVGDRRVVHGRTEFNLDAAAIKNGPLEIVEGDFVVEGLPAGKYDLKTEFGHFVDRQTIEVLAGQTTEVEIREAEAHVLTGRVVDSRGQPLSDVEVELLEDPFLVRLSAVKTDEAGRFELVRVEGSPCKISAAKKGFTTIVEELRSDRNRIELILLTATGRIVGTVVDDSTGRPVVADVCATWPLASRPSFGLSRFSRSGITYEEHGGRFELDRIGAGLVAVTASAGGYFSETQEIEVAENAVLSGVEFRLVPGGFIRGTVSFPDGLEGRAEVVAESEQEGVPGAGATASTGEHAFKIGPLRPGTYRVVASSDDGVAPSDPHQVIVHAGETLDLNLQLQVGVRLLGRVVGADGAPVAGCLVWLNVAKPGPPPHAATDDQGRFSIDELPPGAVRAFVVVRSEELRDALQRPLERTVLEQDITIERGVIEQVVTLTIQNESGVELLGRVLDPQGPVSGATIVFHSDGGVWWEQDPEGFAVTDSRGDFHLKLPADAAGTLTLFRGEGQTQQPRAYWKVDVSDFAARRREFRVPDRRVVGRIRSGLQAQGESYSLLFPWEGNRVGKQALEGDIDEQGAFEIEGVPSGEYACVVVHGLYGLGSLERIRIPDGSTEFDVGTVDVVEAGSLEIVLPRSEVFRARIVLEGDPIWSSVWRPGLMLPPGVYAVRVEIPGRDPIRVPRLEVVAGETTRHVVELD